VARFVAGHLLTSSNYNDDQKKITGGRNGYGRHLRLTSARCLCLTLNPPLSNPHVNTRTHLAHAGAKLANIFSTEFVVETADSNEGKRYKQALLQLSHPIPQQVPLQATACLSQ
jgi:DNA topoisomerase-2